MKSSMSELSRLQDCSVKYLYEYISLFIKLFVRFFVPVHNQEQTTGSANCPSKSWTYSRTRLTDGTHRPRGTRRTLPKETKQWANQQLHSQIELRLFPLEIRRTVWLSLLTCSPFPPLAPFWPCSPTSPWNDKETSTSLQSLKQSAGTDRVSPVGLLKRTLCEGWLLLRVTDLVSVLSGYSRWSGGARQTHGALHSVTTCRSNRSFLALNRRKSRIKSWWVFFLSWMEKVKNLQSTHRNSLLSGGSRWPLRAWSARRSYRSSSTS